MLCCSIRRSRVGRIRAGDVRRRRWSTNDKVLSAYVILAIRLNGDRRTRTGKNGRFYPGGGDHGVASKFLFAVGRRSFAKSNLYLIRSPRSCSIERSILYVIWYDMINIDVLQSNGFATSYIETQSQCVLRTKALERYAGTRAKMKCTKNINIFFWEDWRNSETFFFVYSIYNV